VLSNISKVIDKFGVNLHIISLSTGRKTSLRGVWGTDKEQPLTDQEDGPNTYAGTTFISRNRVLYVKGNNAYVPMVGDSIVDTNEVIKALPNDDVNSQGGYKYNIQTVERYQFQGTNVAYKLEVAG
jgi:hypothetical protein